MIHVVTAAHNRYNITKRFVESLKKQTAEDIHLVFVDDGCTDGTPDLIRQEIQGASILHGNGNLWWGGALHLAYRWFRDNCIPAEDYVLITNDDTVFDENYIETGERLLRENPGVWPVGVGFGMQSGQIRDGLFWHDAKTGEGRLLGIGETGNCASTRSIFLRVGDWMKVGGMHPILLPHYASDFEFTIRAARKGFILQTFAELTCFFDESSTGVNEYDKMTLRKLFSKRSNSNPFYKITFIILSTPCRDLPGHLWHQAKRYVSKVGVFLKILKRKQ